MISGKFICSWRILLTIQYLSLLILLPTKVHADFCYRDENAQLICSPTLADIPPEFQKNSFFKDAPTASQVIQREDPHPQTPPDDISDFSSSFSNQKLRDQNRESLPNIESSTRSTSTLPPAKTFEQAPNDSLIGDRSREQATEPPPPIAELPRRSSNIDSHGGNNTPSKNRPSDLGNQRSSDTQQHAEQSLPPIKVFVADWCAHCRALEQYLSMKGIVYSRINVEQDPEGMALYEQEGSIPITLIGETKVVGYTPEHFDAILQSHERY